VCQRVNACAMALGVDDGMIKVSRDYAAGSLGLAAFDFDRNGYTAEWSEEHSTMLHTSTPLEDAWDFDVKDAALAARWAALEQLPSKALGRRVFDFYRARGFVFPGLPGSAPPYLAQHDWVHVLADYGTTVEAELEVFAFIARANDDMRAYSLLAMVLSLFETGYLRTRAGLFESDPGHLSAGRGHGGTHRRRHAPRRPLPRRRDRSRQHRLSTARLVRARGRAARRGARAVLASTQIGRSPSRRLGRAVGPRRHQPLPGARRTGARRAG